MKADYTKEFAQSMVQTIQLWSAATAAVIDLSVTIDDWMANDANWLAQEYSHTDEVEDTCCYMYSEEEARGQWKCVEAARKKMMAFLLVREGRAIALNPALQMLSA